MLHDAEPAAEWRGGTVEGSGRRRQAMEKDTSILVYATFPSLDEAERIGGRLVDDGLAACVNILPGMVSIYVWQGQRQRDAECAMIINSRAALADRIIETVRGLHPYDNPAIVVLDIANGSPAFLEWILAQTATPN
jgi:periplasmic divalent cation tolerance protein